MREGIEDYELLLVLKQKNPAAAEQLSQEAIPSFTEYEGFKSTPPQPISS